MSLITPVRFTPLVQELPATVPFVGPEAQEGNTGISFRARLGANESCFGPSPKATAAMQDSVSETWKYGDPENYDLRIALADHYRVKPENIMIGEGIDGLFGCLSHLFVEPGRHVVTSLGSYPTFNFHIKSRGGELHLVPYKDDHEYPEALVDKAKETDAVLLYFSNPNNPMGTWRSSDEMQDLIGNLPDGAVLVLDEAYIECAPDGVAPPIDVTNPQVLRFRTFSKAYGMAGARVGYAIGHADVIGEFDKVRNHYGMNRTGQIGAEYALKDQGWLDAIVDKFEAGRRRLYSLASDNDLQYIPSATNFVAIDCGKGPEFAKAVLEESLKRGLFIRMPGVEPQSRCIRVSVGLDHELDLFAEEFPDVLRSAG